MTGALTTIQSWLSDQNLGEIESISPVGGGCINDTSVLTLSDGSTLFCKQHVNPPGDFFSAEAAGLHALQEATSLKVPAVIHVGDEYLLLEDLGTGPVAGNFWTTLGEGLAELHSQEQPTFGFTTDNYCGRTPQVNTVIDNGFDFFAQHRLMALGRKAADFNYLSSTDMNNLEFISANLNRWIPVQPPVLIHGDLWSGNVHADKKGQPALIDPACYWGWAEAELAMTQLFGGFRQEFYSAYEASSGIDSNWRERAPLYNLYHLLNHLVLFGESYLGQVRNIMRSYG